MCGIIAYKGNQNTAGTLVLKGLKKLEYRGYDSWGLAVKKLRATNGGRRLADGRRQTANGGRRAADTGIFIYKKTDKIGKLDIKKLKIPAGNVAMAHTRWATHGKVTMQNAHPQTCCSGRIVIIHNGIIDNFDELKKRLKQKHKFRSGTDTEIIAHLIEDALGAKKPTLKTFQNAIRKTVAKMKGRYAFLAMHADMNSIVAVRRGAPLIVGKGKNNEYFVASDIPAFLEHTNKVMYLDDDEMVTLDGGHSFINLKNGRSVEKRIVKIRWKAQQAEKGKFPHFMIKEIMEQKDTIYRAINQDEKIIKKAARAINKAFGTYLTGCGTAGKVCMAASYLFSKIAKKHVNVEFGSEFPNFRHFIRNRSALIAVSQSGETADTLQAMEVAKKRKAKLLTIINVEGSTMDRMADLSIHIKAGPEKAVASTKATTAQLAILTLLAYACAGKLNEGRKLLLETAAKINDMLNPRYEEHILALARRIKNVESMYVIGRGMNYPMALEAAIKLQEVSYIHAEGFAGGELKHGPIALISKGTPCIALVANDETRPDTISNATEIKARGGYIIGVSPKKEEVFDYWIRVPDSGNASAIVNIIPVQILAYQLAVLRKNNPDMPRNLAKSVTVK